MFDAILRGSVFAAKVLAVTTGAYLARKAGEAIYGRVAGKSAKGAKGKKAAKATA